MAQKYSYTIATAFTTSGGQVNPFQLKYEIKKSSIAPECTKIDTDSGTLDAWFASALDGTEQTTLENIVAAHNPMAYSQSEGGQMEMSLAVGETTSATYQLKKRVNIESLETAYYFIHWSGDVGNSTSKCTTLVRLLLDSATVLSETGFVSDNVHISRKPWSGFQEIQLAEGTHTLDVEFRSTADGGAAQLDNLYINIIKK